MQFQVSLNIKKLTPPIGYADKILLVGSCFTEHIGSHLMNTKFNVLQNPNGILFNPISVCSSLLSYIQNKQYTADDLFYLHECWHSWQHHSRFSNTDKIECLRIINESQHSAHHFLKETDWIIITLGSAFSYRLTGDAFFSNAEGRAGNEVANCHKAPAQNFNKHFCSIEEINTVLDGVIYQLLKFNPKLKIIFTISPVRHLRDGIIDNNRSKARLIESVHHLVNKFDGLYYFPAYELVMDVLRDYRFFDIDLAHPNYAATQFVLERFSETCFSESTVALMEEIKKITVAKNHRPFNPKSNQHKAFLQTQLQKTKQLQQQYPFLNFEKEINHFSE